MSHLVRDLRIASRAFLHSEAFRTEVHLIAREVVIEAILSSFSCPDAQLFLTYWKLAHMAHDHSPRFPARDSLSTSECKRRIHLWCSILWLLQKLTEASLAASKEVCIQKTPLATVPKTRSNQGTTLTWYLALNHFHHLNSRGSTGSSIGLSAFVHHYQM